MEMGSWHKKLFYIFLPILLSGSFSCGEGDTNSPGVDLTPRESVRISANVDRAVATTGDIIMYTVTLSRNPDVEAMIPEIGPQIQGFRIIEMGHEPGKRVEGRMVSERWYKLRADLVGSYALPEVIVEYQEGEESKTVRAGPIYVEVESVLPKEGDATDIRDIKPIIPYPRRPLWYWVLIAAAGAGLLGVSGWLVWRKIRKKDTEVPEGPAWELAREELERLFELGLLEAGEIKSFFFHLSEIFRRYLEKRFKFAALENTREEIVSTLSRIDEIEAGLREVAGDFLDGSDLVKYAKYLPQQEEVEMRVGQVKGFIDKTVYPSPAIELENNENMPSD